MEYKMSHGKNVFIATLPRSGSTLLGMILGSHPQILHIGESSYWGKLDPNNVKCSCGDTGCKFLTIVYEEIKQTPEIIEIYNTCSYIDIIEEPNKIYHSLSLPNDKKIKQYSAQTISEHIKISCIGLKKLTDIFRKISNKNIIVDNTKSIYIAEELLKRQTWKILLLTRNPLGLAYSNKKSGIRKNVPRPLDTKIPVYINFAKKALNLIRYSNVIHIKYEELCLNTEKTIKKLCNFVQVPFIPDMLEFKKNKNHFLMGNRMRFDNNQKITEDLEWVYGLNHEEKNMIYRNSELIELFEKLGYILKNK